MCRTRSRISRQYDGVQGCGGADDDPAAAGVGGCGGGAVIHAPQQQQSVYYAQDFRSFENVYNSCRNSSYRNDSEISYYAASQGGRIRGNS